ncbi:MAG TPA: NUDIX hydrolase, partial [Tepidiformaceae bacterium]|nr:NUDIX hydrolase [Tepidiformaceae bacterium]
MGFKAPGSGREGSCVFLIAADGSILLQQRDDDVPPAGIGRWTPPGGGREPGEDPRQTALREFEEETGIRLERLRYFESVTPDEVAELLPSSLHVFFADDVVARERMVVNEGLDFQYHHPTAFDALPMNPGTRNLLTRFIASDSYRGTVAMAAPWKAGVGVIQLDRWGRALLQLRDADLPPERFPDMWSIPGGLMDHEEAPDAAAVREFEEETGALLQELSLFRVYRKAEIPGSLTDIFHVYFVDADIDE